MLTFFVTCFPEVHQISFKPKFELQNKFAHSATQSGGNGFSVGDIGSGVPVWSHQLHGEGQVGCI